MPAFLAVRAWDTVSIVLLRPASSGIFAKPLEVGPFLHAATDATCLIARPRVEHAVAHWASAVFVDVIGPYLSAPVHDPPVSGGCLQCEEPLAACAARERFGRRTREMHDG